MKAKYTLKEMKDIAKERGGECLSLRYEHQSHTLTSYFFFISILNIRKTTFFMKERNILIMQNFFVRYHNMNIFEFKSLYIFW
ncbi:hypothetical protein LCGC14_1610650 [marine sediment metagenome]|uniref:Uncharacterized protein n=1 Tax=marine sediment metagenome TaxID=412755 RepID=A0A0F9I8M5_9ZZZZ